MKHREQEERKERDRHEQEKRLIGNLRWEDRVSLQTGLLNHRVRSGPRELKARQRDNETKRERERINLQSGLYLAAVSHNQQPY